MRGVLERMIGVTKHIHDAMLSDVRFKSLIHEVLTTFIAAVCVILNARPIVPISQDPNLPEILTPNLLLTQKSCAVTELSARYDIRDTYKSQWKHVQMLAEDFWKRWRREYLQNLQVPHKWTENFQISNMGMLYL